MDDHRLLEEASEELADEPSTAAGLRATAEQLQVVEEELHQQNEELAAAREALEEEAWGKRPSLFEYWGHEASLMPIEMQPLFRWRMERAAHEAWGGMRRIRRERPGYVEAVLEEVRARGPLGAGELDAERPRRTGPWWDWHDAKRALEFLFWSGRVTTAGRRGFEQAPPAELGEEAGKPV